MDEELCREVQRACALAEGPQQQALVERLVRYILALKEPHAQYRTQLTALAARAYALLPASPLPQRFAAHCGVRVLRVRRVSFDTNATVHDLPPIERTCVAPDYNSDEVGECPTIDKMVPDASSGATNGAAPADTVRLATLQAETTTTGSVDPTVKVRGDKATNNTQKMDDAKAALDQLQRVAAQPAPAVEPAGPARPGVLSAEGLRQADRELASVSIMNADPTRHFAPRDCCTPGAVCATVDVPLNVLPQIDLSGLLSRREWEESCADTEQLPRVELAAVITNPAVLQCYAYID